MSFPRNKISPYSLSSQIYQQSLKANVGPYAASKSKLNLAKSSSHLSGGGSNNLRDVTPFRKYKNQTGNNKAQTVNKQSKSIKIEGDLLQATKSPNPGTNKSRSPSPFNMNLNNKSRRNIKNPNTNNMFVINSSYKNKISGSRGNFSGNFIPANNKSVNKISKQNLSLSPNLSSYTNNKSVKTPQSPSPLQGGYNNKFSNRKNFNLGINGNANKYNLRTRAVTPVPKSKFTLSNFNQRKQSAKSPIHFSNTHSNSPLLNNNTSNGVNTGNPFIKNNKINTNNCFPGGSNRNVNNFQAKNIFKLYGNNAQNNINVKQKPMKTTVITMNMNIDQYNQNINGNNQQHNVSDSNTSKLQNGNNNSISNLIENGISNQSSSANINNNQSITNLNMTNKSTNITPLPKHGYHQVVKNIRCMHEFSKTGFAGEDEKKVNQDNYFVFRNFVNSSKHIFMSVCDGHGAVGQEVSGFLKENLPIDLNRAIKASKKNILSDNLESIIKEIFLEVDYKLCSNDMIDSMLSGSTCVSLIYTPSKLITANVGDSRVILGKEINNNWRSVDWTQDHKPSLPEEKRRILSKGGRIEPMRDDDNSFIGPDRVWLKDKDFPGLAMSRSFGDRIAHSVGVSAEPEIREYIFEEEDKFFILASDGLFEFVSSEKIVNIVKDYYKSGDIVGCCEHWYHISCKEWMKEEEVIDDITIILVFLED